MSKVGTKGTAGAAEVLHPRLLPREDGGSAGVVAGKLGEAHEEDVRLRRAGHLVIVVVKATVDDNGHSAVLRRRGGRALCDVI